MSAPSRAPRTHRGLQRSPRASSVASVVWLRTLPASLRGGRFAPASTRATERDADGTSSRQAAAAWPPPRQEEHRDRPGAHQDVVQQHDRHPDRQGGERDRVGVGRLGRVQGLAQVDAVRRAGDRRRRRAQGHGARPAEGRGLRQGPGLRAARRRSARCRPPGSRSSASRTSRRRPTTASAPEAEARLMFATPSVTSHTPGRCNAPPRRVLSRARSLRLRALPASLRRGRFAPGEHDLCRR